MSVEHQPSNNFTERQIMQIILLCENVSYTKIFGNVIWANCKEIDNYRPRFEFVAQIVIMTCD